MGGGGDIDVKVPKNVIGTGCRVLTDWPVGWLPLPLMTDQTLQHSVGDSDTVWGWAYLARVVPMEERRGLGLRVREQENENKFDKCLRLFCFFTSTQYWQLLFFPIQGKIVAVKICNMPV